MKVTFDKNTYEFVVDPEKASNQMTTIERDCFKTINKSIIDGRIIPYISESILTIETINSKDRKSVFSRRDRITVTTKTKTASKNNFVTEVNISSNTDAYPENNDHYQIYLPKAIKLGFKILPIFRFGKIVNPMIKKSWYYIPKSKHNFDIHSRQQRFCVMRAAWFIGKFELLLNCTKYPNYSPKSRTPQQPQNVGSNHKTTNHNEQNYDIYIDTFMLKCIRTK
jgi:hypothetical protein